MIAHKTGFEALRMAERRALHSACPAWARLAVWLGMALGAAMIGFAVAAAVWAGLTRRG